MEVTLEITQYCEHKCDYCSSNASEAGQHLPYEDIENFLHNNNTKLIDRINISGGEPLAHPDFYKILKFCKLFTTDVRVYTNALTHIIYNTSVIKEILVDANVCLTPGKEVYIPENTNTTHLLKLIPQGKAKDMKITDIQISGEDCKNCNHLLLQANGKVVKAPCKKDYGEVLWKKN